MDSFSHQNYTRRWANILQVPVFSVDYRLAPKYPYPDPVNDCFQAYVWIQSQAKEQLGMDIKEFIFSGDSAGGHLCMSVTFLCLLRGIAPPCGLVPIYPVLNLHIDSFLPSNLMFADDELLSTSLIMFVFSAFLRKGGNADRDPILSPGLAPDALMKLLPPTQFVVSEIDGLRDHTHAMALRMLKAGVPTHVHMMADFPHGFCNMDVKTVGVAEFRRATITICKIFIQQLDLERAD